MEESLKFNSQICTTKEQSQLLLDLGLKPETADMYYFWLGGNDYCLKVDVDNNLLKYNMDKTYIPAWSLHRLKCLLPNKIPYKSGYLTVEIINNVNLMFMTDTSEQRVISFIHENLYESMIKCIIWFIKRDYNHEKRHIEDRVLEYCGITDIEASAYLAGYISKFMY